MLTKSYKPIYKIVVEETLDQLSSGAIKVGDRFPPEGDYANKLGISRHTLRQAFAELEHVGVIKRRKRGGTEVIATQPLQHFSIQPTGFYNALGVVGQTLFDLTDVTTVTKDEHVELHNYPNASSKWMRCAGTRTIRDQTTPFVWSKVFVTDQFSEINAQPGDSPSSIYQLIQHRYGVPMSRIKQHYSATLCSDEVALVLGLEPGVPVLTHIAELFTGGGELLVLSYSMYDPARFKLLSDVNVAVNS